MKLNIAGIDYSIRSPSICIFAGANTEEFSFKNCLFYFLSDIKRHDRMYLLNIFGSSFKIFSEESERYDSISAWALDKLQGCDRVSLEGYSFGSQSNRLFQIAENAAILKYKCYQNALPLDIVPPSQIKKFATGKGNASKEDLYVSFLEETGVDIRKEITPSASKIINPVSDIVDSYYICKHLYTKLSHESGKEV
tara:strand:+ start:179 stop:763 length:585 start_codon:yes stop_codon:yes gene_type:complete